MEKLHFKNKRILITHPFIFEINGATNVTLELAKYLQSQQAKVTVFTYVYADPIKEHFGKAGIKVDVSTNNTKHHLRDYDYIWINSQVLPNSILNEFLDAKNFTKMPKLLFMHMAAHDYCPDEMSFLYGFEEKVSSLSMFVSEEAFDFNNNYYEKTPSNIGFYRNPASEDFLCSTYREAEAPKKILVVANILCDELRELRKLLSEKNISIDYLGRDGDRYELVTKELLAQYDAVITFGKTVQYCLISNTPVYVYGLFGGPGWLSKTNYDATKKHNFSGRGFKKKAAEKIVEELLAGYNSAKNYQNDSHSTFCDELLINNVVPKIFEQADKYTPKYKPFTKAQISSYSSSLFLVDVCFNNRCYCYHEHLANERLQNSVGELKNEVENLRKANADLSSIVNSRSVKAWIKLNSAFRKPRNKK